MSKYKNIFHKAAGMIADEGGKAINRFTGSVEAQEGRGKMADEDRMEIIKKRKIREFRKSKGM